MAGDLGDGVEDFADRGAVFGAEAEGAAFAGVGGQPVQGENVGFGEIGTWM